MFLNISWNSFILLGTVNYLCWIWIYQGKQAQHWVVLASDTILLNYASNYISITVCFIYLHSYPHYWLAIIKIGFCKFCTYSICSMTWSSCNCCITQKKTIIFLTVFTIAVYVCVFCFRDCLSHLKHEADSVGVCVLSGESVDWSPLSR